jgi:hypothetical protein
MSVILRRAALAIMLASVSVPVAAAVARDAPSQALLITVAEHASVHAASLPSTETAAVALSALPRPDTASQRLRSLFAIEGRMASAADGAVSVVFWVIGSGLIGVALAARRRKVQDA